ncbi:hypothetical protein OF83DRAFT_1175844, partial [Amylostereum chailletii]
MSDHVSHKPTSIPHLLNPIAIATAPPSPDHPDHGLSHSSPYSNANGAEHVNGPQRSPTLSATDSPQSRVGTLTAASWDQGQQADHKSEYGGRGHNSVYQYPNYTSRAPYVAIHPDHGPRSHQRPRDDPYARQPGQLTASGVDAGASTYPPTSMPVPSSAYLDEQTSYSGDGPPSASPSPYPMSRGEYMSYPRDSSMQPPSARHPSHSHPSVWSHEYGVPMPVPVDARFNPYAHHPPMYPMHHHGPHYYPPPYPGMWYYGVPYPPPQHAQHAVPTAVMPPHAPPPSSRKRPAPNGEDGSPKPKKRRSSKAMNVAIAPASKKGTHGNRDSLSPTEDSLGSTQSPSHGPLHPELQFARCMSNRYKSENFPRCVSCTRRWAGDTCRFQGIRFFLKNDQGDIMGASFVENPKADGPTMNFPTRWDRSLDVACIREIKRTVAAALLPTLKQELDHLNNRTSFDVPARPIYVHDIHLRAVLDVPFVRPRGLRGMLREGASDSEIALLQAKRESHAHSNPFFLSCTRRNEHGFSDFLPTSRFHKEELVGVVEAMEAMIKKEKAMRMEAMEGQVIQLEHEVDLA